MSNNTQNQSIALFIKESRTVFESNSKAFDLAVNKNLADGWIINGQMLVCDGNLVVNMVKVDPALVGVARKVMEITFAQLNELLEA